MVYNTNFTEFLTATKTSRCVPFTCQYYVLSYMPHTGLQEPIMQ